MWDATKTLSTFCICYSVNMSTKSHGIINHPDGARPTDYLYRTSLKCLIRDGDKVLVVKESGRDWWDLPGGGMDHGEDYRTAIARELHEEVGMTGDFTYKIIHAEDPSYLEAHNFWQIRLVFEVFPENMRFRVSDDSDEVSFIDPELFAKSRNSVERKVNDYSKLASAT